MRKFKNLLSGSILTIIPIGDEMEWYYEKWDRHRHSQKTAYDVYNMKRADLFMRISIKYYYNAIGSI